MGIELLFNTSIQIKDAPSLVICSSPPLIMTGTWPLPSVGASSIVSIVDGVVNQLLIWRKFLLLTIFIVLSIHIALQLLSHILQSLAASSVSVLKLLLLI